MLVNASEELYRDDLKYQLSFEEIDWDIFMETVKEAKSAQESKLAQEGKLLI